MYLIINELNFEFYNEYFHLTYRGKLLMEYLNEIGLSISKAGDYKHLNIFNEWRGSNRNTNIVLFDKASIIKKRLEQNIK